MLTYVESGSEYHMGGHLIDGFLLKCGDLELVVEAKMSLLNTMKFLMRLLTELVCATRSWPLGIGARFGPQQIAMLNGSMLVTELFSERSDRSLKISRAASLFAGFHCFTTSLISDTKGSLSPRPEAGLKNNHSHNLPFSIFSDILPTPSTRQFSVKGLSKG